MPTIPIKDPHKILKGEIQWLFYHRIRPNYMPSYDYDSIYTVEHDESAHKLIITLLI